MNAHNISQVRKRFFKFCLLNFINFLICNTAYIIYVPFNVIYILLLLLFLNASFSFNWLLLCFIAVSFRNFSTAKAKTFLRIFIFLSFNSNLWYSDILFSLIRLLSTDCKFQFCWRFWRTANFLLYFILFIVHLLNLYIEILRLLNLFFSNFIIANIFFNLCFNNLCLYFWW